MKISNKLTLGELAALIASELKKSNIDCVLAGRFTASHRLMVFEETPVRIETVADERSEADSIKLD